MAQTMIKADNVEVVKKYVSFLRPVFADLQICQGDELTNKVRAIQHHIRTGDIPAFSPTHGEPPFGPNEILYAFYKMEIQTQSEKINTMMILRACYTYERYAAHDLKVAEIR